jgi:hypothetical protein
VVSPVRFRPSPCPIEVRLRLRRSHDDFDRIGFYRPLRLRAGAGEAGTGGIGLAL